MNPVSHPVVPDPIVLDQMVAVVGEKHALRQKADMAAFVEDTRGRYHGEAALVLRPGSVEEISAILKLASASGTPVIPQGGNTGLVGAGLPWAEARGREVILSLGRMNRILDVDPMTNTMTVESGVVLANIQQAAEEADRLFPLSLGAQGSCQIGGNISSNAGGTQVLAYGNTRELVLGLEAVLPTGEIWNGLSRLRKDNTGYDLKDLLIGAEGTLGVITKAVLKLFPRPRGRAVAFVGLASPKKALALLNRAKGSVGTGLTGFEFMARIAMDFTVKHTPGARHPLPGPYPWFVLIEISSGRSAEDAQQTLEAVLADALEDGLVSDATIALSGEQQAAFWKLREDMSWAQKPEGASIKSDIAVAVGDVPAFIEAADKAVLALVPEARICNFGHMGDGNLHYNISQPPGWRAEDFFAREAEIHEAINSTVLQFSGSISAEHGIGQMKRDKLARIKDPTALMMMRTIKKAFDPAGIMNPGKVLLVD